MRIFRVGDALFCAVGAVVLASGVFGGAGFGIRLHRGAYVLTPGEHRNRINCALSARGIRVQQGNSLLRSAPNFSPTLRRPFRLQSALYCASPSLDYRRSWLRRLDLNQRPSDYESDELPDCSTPRLKVYHQPQPVVVQSCIISLQFRFTCFQRFSRDGTAAVQRRQPQPVGVSANSQNKPFRFNEVVIMLVIPPWRLRPPTARAFRPACNPEQLPVVVMPFLLQVQSTPSFIRQGTPERNRFNSEVFIRPGHPLFVHPFFFLGEPMPRPTTAPSARNEVLISLHGRSIPTAL